ncbi:GPO family capsid scaffolding protein [Aeromonas enteropelogenes]|uniref:GPO family capsid scaffolding protein n=1 Tax=Aeromonas enteropelogenes TaxID=29489 RepID=UPI003BA0A327
MPTPTDSSLRTGWVAIATEGDAIDGRIISAGWITDMAETYDPEFYCAQLWPEHMHFGENAGYVQALKSDTVDGKLTLFAILSPTRDLIYQNTRGQKKFCSIEPWENFANTGKTYLFGIGVTDIPASTGTTMLKFSAKHPNRLIGHSMPLDLSGFAAALDTPPTADRVGLLHQLFNFLAGHGEPTPPAPQESPAAIEEDDDMKEAQFNALNDTLQGLGEQFGTFSAKLDALGKAPAKEEPAKDPAKEGVNEEGGDAAHFTALNDTLKGLGEQFAAMNRKLDQFAAEVPDQRPDPVGGHDTQPLVC